MKIIHIVNSLDCGGQEKMLMGFAAALNCKEHENQIITIAYHGELASQAKSIGINVTSVDQDKYVSFSALWRLIKLLKAKRPDILHLHNGRALVYGAVAAKFLNIPCVFTRHGSGALVFPKWIWFGVKRVIAISSQARNDLLRLNPWLRSNKVSVILNGVNIRDYAVKQAPVRSETGVMTVGHVARLSLEKDQATLLKSFARVVGVLGQHKVRLVIAGDGTERIVLEKLAQDLGVLSQVEFLGYREDIPAIISTFGVFVLSSVTEGIPLTLLEAMAASKPIVATKVGGNPEVVVDGKTGFLVPPQDPLAMAEKILVLLNDVQLSKDMGEAGRKRVRQVFSLARMTDEYEQVYQDVLSQGIKTT